MTICQYVHTCIHKHTKYTDTYTHEHTTDYYLTIKENKIMTSAAIQIDSEIITQSELSQKRKNVI